MKHRMMLSAVALLSTMLPLGADADVIDIPLSVANILPATGPYGNVDINLISPTTANITFTTTSDYLFIDTGDAGINVNATSFSTSNLIGGAGFIANGAKNLDGWGIFNLTFKQNGGFADGVTTESFTLTDLSGTWLSASDVITPNGNGQEVAAHIAQVQTNGQCTGFTAGAINETSVSNGGSGGECVGDVPPPPINTPEPASMILFGSALLGFGLIRRRRQK